MSSAVGRFVDAELWPDATHAISGEHADRVNARVLEFVAAVERRASGRAAQPRG